MRTWQATVVLFLSSLNPAPAGPESCRSFANLNKTFRKWKCENLKRLESFEDDVMGIVQCALDYKYTPSQKVDSSRIRFITFNSSRVWLLAGTLYFYIQRKNFFHSSEKLVDFLCVYKRTLKISQNKIVFVSYQPAVLSWYAAVTCNTKQMKTHWKNSLDGLKTFVRCRKAFV